MELNRILAIKRLKTFEDVANVIYIFIRPENEVFTGHELYLGGFSGHFFGFLKALNNGETHRN